MRPFLPFAAVLTAAFLLGCQDQGSEPVGPDVFVLPSEPQFDKPAPMAPCPEARVKGHCHVDDEEPTGRPQYTVVVTGDVEGDLAGSGLTTPVRGGEIIVDGFVADLTFFVTGDGQAMVSCGGPALTTPKTGTFTILTGDDHLHLGFNFMHNDASHHIGLLATTIPANWPPTTSNAPAMFAETDGSWVLSSRGKNHQNACTGEGSNIAWSATVTFVP